MTTPSDGVKEEDLRDHLEIAVHLRSGVRRWTGRADALPLDGSKGSPWMLIPPDVRCAFDAVAAGGVPLADTAFGPPLLGVKSGCNEAFLVALADDDDPGAAVARVRPIAHAGHGRVGTIERALLRPVLRGETLSPWGGRPGPDLETPRPGAGRPATLSNEWIVWTHAAGESESPVPLASLPPLAARWLEPWRHRLAARSDTRGRDPWWALFRTESARVARARVVWADLGQVPRAAVLAIGDRTVALNSCYVACAADATDAHALAALLNSAVAAAWLNAFAEPARGHFRRYLGWTVGLLPVPRAWNRVRHLLAAVGQRAVAGEPPSVPALTVLVAAAYGLSSAALAPLLEWGSA